MTRLLRVMTLLPLVGCSAISKNIGPAPIVPDPAATSSMTTETCSDRSESTPDPTMACGSTASTGITAPGPLETGTEPEAPPVTPPAHPEAQPEPAAQSTPTTSPNAPPILTVSPKSRSAKPGPYHLELGASAIATGRVVDRYVLDGASMITIEIEDVIVGEVEQGPLSTLAQVPKFGCHPGNRFSVLSDSYTIGMSLEVYLTGNADNGWRLYGLRPARFGSRLAAYVLALRAEHLPPPEPKLDMDLVLEKFASNPQETLDEVGLKAFVQEDLPIVHRVLRVLQTRAMLDQIDTFLHLLLWNRTGPFDQALHDELLDYIVREDKRYVVGQACERGEMERAFAQANTETLNRLITHLERWVEESQAKVDAGFGTQQTITPVEHTIRRLREKSQGH